MKCIRMSVLVLSVFSLMPVLPGIASSVGTHNGAILIGGAGDGGQVGIYNSNLDYVGTLVDGSSVTRPDPFPSTPGDRYQRTATPFVRGATLRSETVLWSID